MKTDDFVDAIRTEAQEAASSDVITLLENPPGRRPDPELVELSQWFNTLSDFDKQHVSKVASLTSREAVFGVLAILDGVRVVEDGAERGRLELRYVKDSDSRLLNDPSGPFLHELL